MWYSNVTWNGHFRVRSAISFIMEALDFDFWENFTFESDWNLKYLEIKLAKPELSFLNKWVCGILASQTKIWLWQVAVVMFSISISRNKWRLCQGVKRNCRIFPAINFKWKWPNFENKSLLSRNGPTNHLSIKMHMHKQPVCCLWVSF